MTTSSERRRRPQIEEREDHEVAGLRLHVLGSLEVSDGVGGIQPGSNGPGLQGRIEFFGPDTVTVSRRFRLS